MEITPNSHVEPAPRVSAGAVKARAPQTDTGNDSVAFSRSAALEQALKATADVRAGVVDRARQLVSSVKYPPAAAIEGIAALLALKLSDSRDGAVHNQA